jgi:hypothetical protein
MLTSNLSECWYCCAFSVAAPFCPNVDNAYLIVPVVSGISYYACIGLHYFNLHVLEILISCGTESLLYVIFNILVNNKWHKNGRNSHHHC